MKKVNFINTLSPKKQHEIYRWFCYSSIVFIIALLISVYFVIPPFLNYWTLKKEIASLHEKIKTHAEMVKKKDVLKAEYDTLHQHAQKIDHYKERLNNIYEHLVIIFTLSSDEIKIESVRCNKKGSEITINCLTPEHAMVYAKHLAASDKCADVKVLSLHHDGSIKRFRSVIKTKNNFL